MADSSQKFITRNRPPRVQIVYEVETYGSMKKKELPFVMAVMANLSGDSAGDLPPVGERGFTPVDVDNINAFMKSVGPTAGVKVKNTLLDDGSEFSVKLKFENLDDFNPARVAAQFDGTRQLLEARTQLANLLTYMDGKANAEKQILELLQKPDLLKSLCAAPKPQETADQAEAAPADGQA